MLQLADNHQLTMSVCIAALLITKQYIFAMLLAVVEHFIELHFMPKVKQQVAFTHIVHPTHLTDGCTFVCFYTFVGSPLQRSDKQM